MAISVVVSEIIQCR